MGLMNRLAGFAFPLSILGTGVGITVLVKDSYGGVECSSNARIDGKTVIVTGANTGIGKETALELARRGGRIVLACRDLEKGKAAAEEIIENTKNPNVKVFQLDLASLESIKSFVTKFTTEEKKLHILINNAGIMRCPRWKTADGFEMQFGVNHLGHFYLTNLLLDNLKDSAPSRIVNVSSISHTRGRIEFDNLNAEKHYSSSEAYADSKLAIVLFTRELSKRLKGCGVTANVLHPGIVQTKIGRHTGMQQSAFSMSVLGPLFWLFVKTPIQGAQTSIYCAVAEELENTSGKYFIDCKEKECAPEGQDDAVAEKLWDVSAQMVGLVNRENEQTHENTRTMAPS
ncbi:retinol dehydrogenase 13-like isoform X2 [Ptychodera flava]|uniref:retinol dehydrogenase 13-like isoform X2 n=1 Tax=Ptychodera flava TaxID=63121 RepID=UPI00396AAC88